jgi:hypothetical protein
MEAASFQGWSSIMRPSNIAVLSRLSHWREQTSLRAALTFIINRSHCPFTCCTGDERSCCGKQAGGQEAA